VFAYKSSTGMTFEIYKSGLQNYISMISVVVSDSGCKWTHIKFPLFFMKMRHNLKYIKLN